MTDQSPDTQAMLDALHRAVNEALEKKRKLGHYVVLWEQGEIRVQGEDSPVKCGNPKANPARAAWIEENND